MAIGQIADPEARLTQADIKSVLEGRSSCADEVNRKDRPWFLLIGLVAMINIRREHVAMANSKTSASASRCIVIARSDYGSSVSRHAFSPVISLFIFTCRRRARPVYGDTYE